jgi:hypothetical protein
MDLLLETIQIHREDTQDTPEEFRRRFPVGLMLTILTTTEISFPDKGSENNDPMQKSE